jgi:hypothetical protein
MHGLDLIKRIAEEILRAFQILTLLQVHPEIH